jgi:hypothetical protein
MHEQTSEHECVQDEVRTFADVEHVKVDLIASKGIVFIKFKTASSALRAKEDIERNNFQVRIAPHCASCLNCGHGHGHGHRHAVSLCSRVAAYGMLANLCLPTNTLHQFPQAASSHEVQMMGKRVNVQVADPKSHTRSSFRDDDPRGTRSCTPPEGLRESHLGSLSSQSCHGSGMSLPLQPPSDSFDCNPLFWGWVHSQGILMLDSAGSVQKLHTAWQQQGCPGPNQVVGSLSRSVSYNGQCQPPPNLPFCSSAPAGMPHHNGGDDNVCFLLHALCIT